jgi:hypothetical protein
MAVVLRAPLWGSFFLLVSVICEFVGVVDDVEVESGSVVYVSIDSEAIPCNAL